MCLACEAQQELFRGWCADLAARGERPPGVSPQDLLAMGLPIPPSAGGPPGPSSARRGQGAATFTCDSPDE
jgi:hypothetical protein